jgi:3-deoxy-D-manno-octulosonic-acid transferase
MKYDLHDGNDALERQHLRHNLREHYVLDEDMPVVVGGSIHCGEDLALAWAYSRLVKEGYRLRMAVVPRYPAEAPAVALALEQQGLVPLRKEGLSPDERDIFSDPLHVLVVDTMGELKQFYTLADIAYVGGSLLYRGSNKGGHNLMEPAILGLAVMFGPHNYSFRETVRDLLDNGAGLLVHNRDELFSSLKNLLEEPTFALELGEKARQVILKNRGAAGKNFTLLSKFPPFVRN